jgi:DNA helicase HerA-like ATPase
MSGILVACLFLQDPFQQQIDDSLRQFEAATEIDQALTLLSAQLMALGAQATSPIARRLAADLRDGMASAAAPAFIDALVGRPDALVPLQTAFRDATTSVTGRIELAEALLQLDDAMSWRAGLLAISTDARTLLPDRLRALKVLLEAEDPQVPGLLRSLANNLPELPELQQRDVVDFLVAQDTPLTRELLVSIASDDRLSEAVRRVARPRPSVRATPEDPGEQVVEGAARRSAAAIPRTIVKKRETAGSSFLTMPSILAGGVTLVLLVLLLVEILRKG